MATGDKTAIFYITDNGLSLAQRLKGLFPDTKVLRFSSEILTEIWKGYKSLIFIMAAGIVIRAIAPLIKDKRTDPAVVVLDEKGAFVISLLSGHIGGANKITREIAGYLGAEAVITTASDVQGRLSIDLWAIEKDLYIEDFERLKKISAKIVNGQQIRLKIVQPFNVTGIPEEFIVVDSIKEADVIISHRFIDSDALFLRPKTLTAGIGCNRGTRKEEIEEALKAVFSRKRISYHSLRNLATIEIKRDEKGLSEFAGANGLDIDFFSKDELNRAVLAHNIKESRSVKAATGANAVAEPAALLSAGTSTLLIPKQKIGNVTIAVAEILEAKIQNSKFKIDAFVKSRHSRKSGNPGSSNYLKRLDSRFHGNDNKVLFPIFYENIKINSSLRGKIYIVGTGPGTIEHITPYARDALRRSDVIVGYSTYLCLIHELIKDKEVVSTGMTQEIDRCKKAVEIALSGRTVSVISSGDPGIYAMAGLVLEILKAEVEKLRSWEDKASFPTVEVIPGISAMNACASRLGAPLMHDFASISLSDRLTPWEVIEKRLEAAAAADFVIVLYNPKSKGRLRHIDKALKIILRHRWSETPVGIVKGAMRKNEKIVITDLKNMLDYDIDMQTTVIIGNSKTFLWNNLMITPRGYEIREYEKLVS